MYFMVQILSKKVKCILWFKYYLKKLNVFYGSNII